MTSLTRPRAWRHAHSHALIWRELLDFRSRSNTRDFPAAAERSGERHNNKAMGEMSGFENRLQSYSSTQLLEQLEDDDKLRRMVGEMDEVGLTGTWLSFSDRERESNVTLDQWQLLELSCFALFWCILGQSSFTFDYSGVDLLGVLLTEGVADGENECQTEWRQCEWPYKIKTKRWVWYIIWRLVSMTGLLLSTKYVISFLYSNADDTLIQVHLNKLECRGKVHLFQ